MVFHARGRHARQGRVQQGSELLGQAQRMQVLAQREAPGRQAAVTVEQLQVAHAGMVVQLQPHAGAVGPGLPFGGARRARQYAMLRQKNDTFGEMQF